MAKPVKICFVLYHDPKSSGGPFGDGSFTQRFRANKQGLAAATSFSQGKEYYGKPATVETMEVSRDQARRYGLA